MRLVHVNHHRSCCTALPGACSTAQKICPCIVGTRNPNPGNGKEQTETGAGFKASLRLPGDVKRGMHPQAASAKAASEVQRCGPASLALQSSHVGRWLDFDNTLRNGTGVRGRHGHSKGSSVWRAVLVRAVAGCIARGGGGGAFSFAGTSAFDVQVIGCRQPPPPMEKRKQRTKTAAWWTFTEGKGREGQRMAIGQWAPPAADESTIPWLLAKPPPCVTFRLVVAPLRGPGRSPVLPFACCVGSLLSVGRCGRCSCWCRFRVRGAQ